MSRHGAAIGAPAAGPSPVGEFTGLPGANGAPQRWGKKAPRT
jgi:hypothetical protein